MKETGIDQVVGPEIWEDLDELLRRTTKPSLVLLSPRRGWRRSVKGRRIICRKVFRDTAFITVKLAKP